MNKEKELEIYLSISEIKFEIYLFDIKSQENLYKEELILKENEDSLNLIALKKFLDSNIFKIEKLSGKFVENIFLIFDDKKNLNVEMGIKKKNYSVPITNGNLENSLIEAKDLFRENYQKQEIMHMIINKYFINGKSYSSLQANLNSDDFALEVQFKSIPNSTINNLNKILEDYQIKITKCLDGDYVKSSFDKNLELSEMSHKILKGHNENEVTFVPKNLKKIGFFEKFFQLFS